MQLTEGKACRQSLQFLSSCTMITVLKSLNKNGVYRLINSVTCAQTHSVVVTVFPVWVAAFSPVRKAPACIFRDTFQSPLVPSTFAAQCALHSSVSCRRALVLHAASADCL